MLNLRRSLRAAALASLIAAGGTALHAQGTETVGPPALKDFQLQGERTTPAAEPTPSATTPGAASPAPATGRPPPASTRPAPSRPAAAAVPRNERPVAAAPAPQIAPAPVADAPAEAAPLPAPVAAPDAAPTASAGNSAAPQQPAAPPATGDNWNWLWLAIPAGLGLLAFFALRRRPRRPVRASKVSATPEPATRPVATPEPMPEPVPVASARRARLEVEFRPEKAAATDSEAVVHYDLVLHNVGDVEAGNIRIDSRMFNAGAEKEIDGFVNGPIHEHSGSPHVTIAPGDTLNLASRITLPKSQLREIEMQGRRVFVPIVAINVAYDWQDGGKGRTSQSWLVGREPEQPAAKMGAFRLDLGPRIYRSVGQRPTKLANVA